MSEFGRFIKERRERQGQSLRGFCIASGVDASNWSKMERGRIPPPQGEQLHRYAELLGITEGSDEWYRLVDLAAAEAGRLPEDLMGADLAAKLPVFFRTLREVAKDGGTDDDVLIEEIKRKIKGA